MAKITLGKRPKTFVHKLKVLMLDGSTGEIRMTFTYRTRKEFGQFLDELFNEAKMRPESLEPKDIDAAMALALAAVVDQNAAFIMKVAEGWDLCDPETGEPTEFSQATVEQLCNELPGVALAIIAAYRAAVSEGRLGN